MRNGNNRKLTRRSVAFSSTLVSAIVLSLVVFRLDAGGSVTCRTGRGKVNRTTHKIMSNRVLVGDGAGAYSDLTTKHRRRRMIRVSNHT
jgi:hypothetical protein